MLHLKREKSLRRLLSVCSADQMATHPRAEQGSSSCLSLEPQWCETAPGTTSKAPNKSIKFGVFLNTCLISSVRCLPALALTFSQLCAQQKWLVHLRDLGKRLNLQILSPNLTRRLLGTNLSHFLSINCPVVPS